jgi:uncharacterized membrane protein HdeD (DUF308 family)
MSTTSLTGSEEHAPGWARWLLMFLGALCVAAGVIVLAKPGDSLATLAVIVGIFMLVDGCFEIGMSFSRRTESRGLVALLGVLNAVIGIVLIRHPFAGVAAIAILTGLWLVCFGVIRFISAFETREHRVWNVVVAVVEVVAGVVILADPNIGFATLALLIGIAFIARGVALFAFGWMLHAVSHAEAPPHPPTTVAPA